MSKKTSSVPALKAFVSKEVIKKFDLTTEDGVRAAFVWFLDRQFDGELKTDTARLQFELWLLDLGWSYERISEIRTAVLWQTEAYQAGWTNPNAVEAAPEPEPEPVLAPKYGTAMEAALNMALLRA